VGFERNAGLQNNEKKSWVHDFSLCYFVGISRGRETIFLLSRRRKEKDMFGDKVPSTVCYNFIMNVSTKVFILNQKNEILVLFRTEKVRARPNTWDIPGGKLEEGEDLEDGLSREVKEETGLDIGQFTILGATSAYNVKGEFWVQIGYTSNYKDDSSILLSEEHSEYRWITKDDFFELESSERLKKLCKLL
jgi:8-oxo-dGTP diphosphatase